MIAAQMGCMRRSAPMTKGDCASMKRTIILLGIGLLLSAPALAVEPEYGPRKGDWELSVGGGSANDDQWESKSFGGNLTGNVGYFYTDELEVLVRNSLIISGARGTDDTAYIGNSRLALDYHLPLGRFYPFIGVNFGGVFGHVEASASGGPEAGVKYYAQPNAFLFAMGEYQWFIGDAASKLGTAYDHGMFLATIGMGIDF
jgi:hypothetical protein